MSRVFYRKGDQHKGIANGPWDVDILVVEADDKGVTPRPDGWVNTPWEACGTDENGKPLKKPAKS